MPSSRPRSDHRVAVALDGERERRARAGVADRVLGEVPRDHAEHARPDRELDRRRRTRRAARRRRGRRAPRARRRPPRAPASPASRRARRRARPTRARERNSTSSMSSVIWSISPRACSTSAGTSSPGSVVVSSSGEQPRERRPQLVRDGGREPRAQLLVRREVALAREVDEPLAPAARPRRGRRAG